MTNMATPRGFPPGWLKVQTEDGSLRMCGALGGSQGWVRGVHVGLCCYSKAVWAFFGDGE